MRNQVTVVPSDKIIIVDGASLRFEFTAPENLHAVQWRNGSGYIEFTDDLNHTISGAELYAEEVEPYVALWEKEKSRLEEEGNKPPAIDEQIAIFTSAIQRHLDAFARTRNYDGIMSAATYATSTVQKFKAEGQYAVEARDLTWEKGYEILGEVLSGARQLPTIAEVIAELPPLVWPEVGS